MANSALVLGIDFGTSGVRIAVLNMDGELIHTSSTDYQKGLEDPEDWQECCKVLIQALPNRYRQSLVALAVDGTSGTILACDHKGKPIGQALPYHLSCLEQKQALSELIPDGKLAASVSSSLSRALRLTAKHGANVLLRHQADWISGWLLGDWRWGEEGNNLRLGWDLNAQAWPKSMEELSWRSALPEIVCSGSILGTLATERAKNLNLPEKMLVVAGTTDANAAVLSANPGPEDGITILGSTLVLKRFIEHPIQGSGISNHRVGGRWLCGGASNTGCSVLRQLFSDAQLQELSQQINPKMDSGLKLRPMPRQGERFPVDDPMLKPVMGPRPVSDALYLHGLLEGLARIEAKGWQKLNELGAAAPKQVISLGGGARNPQWRQLRQRILKLPITTCTLPPAAGVARLALEAVKPQYKG